MWKIKFFLLQPGLELMATRWLVWMNVCVHVCVNETWVSVYFLSLKFFIRLKTIIVIRRTILSKG